MDKSNNRNQRISEIEARLSELKGERKRLVVELTTLQSSTRSPDELPALMGLPRCPVLHRRQTKRSISSLDSSARVNQFFRSSGKIHLRARRGTRQPVETNGHEVSAESRGQNVRSARTKPFHLSTPRRLKTTFKASVRSALMPFAKTTPARSLRPISTVMVGAKTFRLTKPRPENSGYRLKSSDRVPETVPTHGSSFRSQSKHERRASSAP